MKTNSNIKGQELGELLKSYYQGRLSGDELQKIESLRQEDEFLADAMEGFDEFPEAIATIPSFKTNNSKKMWLTVGGFALVAIASFFVYTWPEPITETTEVAQVITQELAQQDEEEIIEITKPETSEKEIIVPVTQIKPKKEKTIATKNEAIEIPKREYFEIPKMELNPIEIQQKTDYTIKKAKTKALMYYNFLAIDYSVIYTNTIPVQPDFGGIDASKSNKTEKGIELGNGSVEKIITYKQQLKNSLYQLKDQNYSSAIENFEIILTHFPQDANAQFYIGYALFYQENYEKAIPYFEKSMTNGFDFFYEDAEWFKANSLENMGKLKEAQTIYRKIKNKGGYYSYQVR